MLQIKFDRRATLTALSLMVLFIFFAYPVCAQSAERNVRVATRLCPPFVMEGTSKVSGISINHLG